MLVVLSVVLLHVHVSRASVAELSVLSHAKSVYRLVLVKLVYYGRTVASLVRAVCPFFETVCLLLEKVLSLCKELHESGLLVDLHGKSRTLQGH